MKDEVYTVRIEVYGGTVQEVEVPAGVRVEVYDYDGEGPGDFHDKDEAGEPCNIGIWETT
jgi:hypothetical protein